MQDPARYAYAVTNCLLVNYCLASMDSRSGTESAHIRRTPQTMLWAPLPGTSTSCLLALHVPAAQCHKSQDSAVQELLVTSRAPSAATSSTTGSGVP